MWWSMKRYLRKWFRICFLELSQHYLILQKLEVLRQMLVGNLWISRREDILIWTQESLSRTKNWCPHSWRLSRSRSGRKPRLCDSRSRAYANKQLWSSSTNLECHDLVQTALSRLSSSCSFCTLCKHYFGVLLLRHFAEIAAPVSLWL